MCYPKFWGQNCQWCKLSHVSPPRTTTSEVQARNCFNCIRMLLGRYKTPVFHLLAGQSFFRQQAWKLFLLDSMWMKRQQRLFCDLDSRKSNKESRQAARRDGNSSGIREAGKPLLTSTLLPQPPKPLPSPVLELTTKLFWFRDQIDVLS